MRELPYARELAQLERAKLLHLLAKRSIDRAPVPTDFPLLLGVLVARADKETEKQPAGRRPPAARRALAGRAKGWRLARRTSGHFSSL